MRIGNLLRQILDVVENRNRHLPKLVAHHLGIGDSQQPASIAMGDLQNLLAQADEQKRRLLFNEIFLDQLATALG